VSDAAMSSRAECVMLNNGPHITDTVLRKMSISEIGASAGAKGKAAGAAWRGILPRFNCRLV